MPMSSCPQLHMITV